MTAVVVDRRNVWVTARSRGAITGLGLVLLGAWGAVIPFIGPYFHFGYPPQSTWTWTATRGWLEVLPGAATFLAGLVLLVTASRVVGVLASWLAAAAGAWFVLGPLLAPVWDTARLGTPVGTPTDASMAQLGMFYGLGAVIMLFAGTALGRFSLVAARDVARAEQIAANEEAAVVTAAPSEVVEEPIGAARGTTVGPDGSRRQPRHGWAHRRRTTTVG